MSPRRPLRDLSRPGRPDRPGRRTVALAAFFLAGAATAFGQAIPGDQDRIDLTGRQNLTLGSGARAYGMGGAFLARPDDATAASWNPAGLSYLRLPEVSLVGNSNSFTTDRPTEKDHFAGTSFDFAAFTWPVGIGGVRGAVQLSYQRAISFDGERTITRDPDRQDVGSSHGGFDVVAFGTGFRLSRNLRAGLTVNRWLNGYDQQLNRNTPTLARPIREFQLDFRPQGWNFNLGLIWSPIEELNLGVVYKTPFTAGVSLAKQRFDTWALSGQVDEVTTNAYSSDAVRLEFPSSFGFGASWRLHDTLTVSADYTLTSWSKARILNYFDLLATQPKTEENPAPQPPSPVVYASLPYPTRVADQQDSQQIRAGVEWVLIAGRIKVPLRAGYFNDRQILANPNGDTQRFNGVTVGTGVILGSLLLDVAYLYEFGQYYVAADQVAGGNFDVPPTPLPPARYALNTRRFFASLIYRFPGRR